MNKPEAEMTEEELQFHYFKLHDYDNNNQLDGIEIGNAMTHYHKGNSFRPCLCGLHKKKRRKWYFYALYEVIE